jgi:hypothetical protein
MRVRLLPLLLVLALWPLMQLLYPGCATLIDGPTQQVRVRSKPAGATVFVDGKQVGLTPATAVVSRWGWHRVRIEMPGYEPYEVKLEKRSNSNATGNLYIGGVWIVVDALTGAIYDLRIPPEAEKETARFPRDSRQYYPEFFGPTTLHIATELKRTPAARKIGQMQRR